MDSITAIARGMDNPLLQLIGMGLDSSAIYGIIILILVIVGDSRDDKRKKIVASLAVALLLATALKYLLMHERPCAGLEWCPEDYSFPSLHATVAFALMTGFLNKKSYPYYLAFALFVSFSRMNMGVHTFLDIAGALPVALIAYYLTDILWREKDG